MGRVELHAGAARGRSLGVKPCTPAGSTFHTAGEFVAQSSLLLSLSKAEPCPHTGQSMCFAVLIVRKRVSRNRDLSVPFPPAPPHCLTWSPARPDAALRQVPRPSGAPLPHSLSHLGPLLGSQGDGRDTGTSPSICGQAPGKTSGRLPTKERAAWSPSWADRRTHRDISQQLGDSPCRIQGRESSEICVDFPPKEQQDSETIESGLPTALRLPHCG